MEVSSDNVADSAAVVHKKKMRTLRDKYMEYEVGRLDRETPFNGHQCKALRQQLGYTAAQLAKLIGCIPGTIYSKEASGGYFSRRNRTKLNRIKRLADKAAADLRDRYEMPNFQK